MNTKVWYVPYFAGVYHTRTIEIFSNANARMVRMTRTLFSLSHTDLLKYKNQKIKTEQRQRVPLLLFPGNEFFCSHVP